MSEDCFWMGLSMELVCRGSTGMVGLSSGKEGKHRWKQSLPHFRISPFDQEIVGSCAMSHSRPNTIPTLDLSRTSKKVFSVWSMPTWSWIGSTQWLTLPLPMGFPVIEWIWYFVVFTFFLSPSWSQRLEEMKLAADPESRLNQDGVGEVCCLPLFLSLRFLS